MASLIDWLNDTGIFGGGGSGGSAPMPPVQPMDTAPPAPAPDPSATMPPVQPLDMTSGPGTGGAPPPSALPPPGAVPLPQPRPPGADAMSPPAAAPVSGTGLPIAPSQPPGPPLNIAPTTAQPPQMPAQTWLGRALGITPDQFGAQGQQVGAGLAAGLKSVGDNWNKPGLAAFAGSAGAAMEGGSKEALLQQKQAADYLNAAIKSKQAGDEAGYKQNYLQYLAAKLKSDTDKAASKDATTTNKNDSPTQLYLSAQRLVEPDRRAMNVELQKMRASGADPAAITARQAQLEAEINAKLADHYATLGIHPQTAADLAKQPGNAQENPIDAAKTGITKDNISKKLQPGQYYRNPSDGKVYQYKGPQQGQKNEAVSGVPDKPTAPEPPNPMKPYKTPAEGSSSDDDDE